jgi:DNA-binding transcriptional regulator YiaG
VSKAKIPQTGDGAEMLAHRTACEATQKEWAETLGVWSTQVSRWEKGSQSPRLRFLRKARILSRSGWKAGAR